MQLAFRDNKANSEEKIDIIKINNINNFITQRTKGFFGL